MSAVAAGAVFFGVLLLIVAGMVIQETRRRPAGEIVYVLEEVVPFVHQRLSDDAFARVDRDDVQRMLEWEVHYLQGLDRRGNGDAPVAGGDEAVDYVLERTSASGHRYRRDDIAEVLAREADYLAEIGAVGPPLGGPA